jgi:uncharacterized protein YkwD
VIDVGLAAWLKWLWNNVWRPGPVTPPPSVHGRPLLDAINVARVEHGRAALTWDDGLAGVSADNDRLCRLHGRLGHFDTGDAWQCAAWGQGDAGTVVAGWLGDPPHAGIVLHPGLTRGGGDGLSGSYWTFTAR